MIPLLLNTLAIGGLHWADEELTWAALRLGAVERSPFARPFLKTHRANRFWLEPPTDQFSRSAVP